MTEEEEEEEDARARGLVSVAMKKARRAPR